MFFRPVTVSFTIVQTSYIRIGRGFPKYYSVYGRATYVLFCLCIWSWRTVSTN